MQQPKMQLLANALSDDVWLVNITFPGRKGITLQIAADKYMGGQIEISPAQGTGLATDELPNKLIIDVT